MTDQEFDIIDELYFVTAYSDLKEQVECSEEELHKNLISLANKGWIKVYRSVDEESELSDLDIVSNFKTYFYLASKKGLLKHNSR